MPRGGIAGWNDKCVLNFTRSCISLMAECVEHIFMYILIIYVYSFVRSLFRSFDFFSLLFPSFENSFLCYGYRPVLDLYIVNPFSQSCLSFS